MLAAESRRKALVEAMLDFNPDLTSKNRRDKTALDYAKGDDEISSLIRERGGPSTHSRVSIDSREIAFSLSDVHRSFIRQPCKAIILIPYHAPGSVPVTRP